MVVWNLRGRDRSRVSDDMCAVDKGFNVALRLSLSSILPLSPTHLNISFPKTKTKTKTNANSPFLVHSTAWVRIQKETSEDEKRRSPSPDFRGGPGPSDNVQHPGYEPYQRVSRWERFATAYPQIDRLQEKLVDEEWLCENFGDLSGPWGPEGSGLQRPPKRRKTWRTRCHQELLYNPVVPLIIRMIVFGFSVVALALGASIRHYAEKYEHVPKGPSALMAIIVDAVALVYLIYVSYDEFRGKPLGLRSPFSKMRLILLDLFFIIFDSANLSLAFSALSDIRESCEAGNINDQFNPISNPICERQKALASVLLIALIAWVMNFSLSIFR